MSSCGVPAQIATSASGLLVPLKRPYGTLREDLRPAKAGSPPRQGGVSASLRLRYDFATTSLRLRSDND